MEEMESENSGEYTRRDVLSYAGAAGVGGFAIGAVTGYGLAEGPDEAISVDLNQSVEYEDHEVAFTDIMDQTARVEVSREDQTQILDVPQRGIYDLNLGEEDEDYDKIFEAQRVFFSPDGDDGELVFEIDERLD